MTKYIDYRDITVQDSLHKLSNEVIDELYDKS